MSCVLIGNELITPNKVQAEGKAIAKNILALSTIYLLASLKTGQFSHETMNPRTFSKLQNGYLELSHCTKPDFHEPAHLWYSVYLHWYSYDHHNTDISLICLFFFSLHIQLLTICTFLLLLWSMKINKQHSSEASKTEALDLCQLPRPPYEIHEMINLPASVKVFKNGRLTMLSVTCVKSDKIPFLNMKKWHIGKIALKCEEQRLKIVVKIGPKWC